MHEPSTREYFFSWNYGSKRGQLAIELFMASDKYDIQSLKNLSKCFVAQNITERNVVFALEVSPGLLISSLIKMPFLHTLVKRQKMMLSRQTPPKEL